MWCRLSVGALLALMLGCSTKSNKASLPKEPPKVEVKAVQHVAKMKEDAQANSSKFLGEVIPRNRTQLAFEVPGTVSQVFVKPGSIVKKGTILAMLNQKDMKIRVRQAKARRDQAKLQATMAHRNFERLKQLQSSQVLSQAEFEGGQTNTENARLVLELAEAELELAEKAYGDTQLIAPYDCVVTRQMKFVGDQIAMMPGAATAFEIYDAGSPEIMFNIPEAFLHDIHVGDVLSVLVPALKQQLKAKVIRKSPVIDQMTRNFQVYATFNDQNVKITPGYFVEGTLSK